MNKGTLPFQPKGQHCTVSMPVGHNPAASYRVQFDNILPGSGVNKCKSVRVFNAGPDLVLFELVGGQGDQSVNVSNGIPLAPNTAMLLGTAGGTAIAAICPNTNATLYATPGEGNSI